MHYRHILYFYRQYVCTYRELTVYVYVETDKVLRDNICSNRQYVLTDIVISYNIFVFTCNIFTHVVVNYVYLHVCVYRQHECLRIVVFRQR